MSYNDPHPEATAMINKILESNGRPLNFTEKQLKNVIMPSKQIFNEQSILLDLQPPLKIVGTSQSKVGNINGHLSDLVNIFKMSGYPGEVCYLFLGDYIDKVPTSLEVIVLLLCYKIKFPEHVFLLRGHHQTASVNRCFGFYDQCKERASLLIWRGFNEIFSVMPLCALIQKKIFCVHGGISPQLESVDQIQKIGRPLEITNNGISLDMLWSDPELVSGWQQNERGLSYYFGHQAANTFLKNNKLDLIVRSHQLVQNGFEFMFNKQIVTIFSVPNFMGEYQNSGAIMVVEEGLKCSFEIIKPKFKHKKDLSQTTNPFKK